VKGIKFLYGNLREILHFRSFPVGKISLGQKHSGNNTVGVTEA